MSVSSDLIAVTAFRCAGLLRQLGVTDRSGGRVVEVYPAAALARWGLPSVGYKGSQAAPQRWSLVQQLEAAAPFLNLSKEHRDLLIASDHAFDALVAALVARCVAHGLTQAPAVDDRAIAAREGWIAVPDEQALSTFAVEFRTVTDT